MDIKVISKSDKELILEIHGEDHTLGNMIMKEALRHPAVNYAAYRVLHPLKDVIEIFIVTKEGVDVSSVLREVINRLRDELREFVEVVNEVLKDQ